MCFHLPWVTAGKFYFKGDWKTLFQRGCTMYESFSCSTFLSTLEIVNLLKFSHPSRCVLVFHFSFSLHFPNDKWCWVPFHVLNSHLFIFFHEKIVQIRAFFFSFFLIGLFNFLLLGCKVSLNIPERSTLWDIFFLSPWFVYSVS